MATLDPRLLDLIETLTAVRLDWLAFELIEGLQAGRVRKESEEVLAMTRRAVAGKEQPKPRGEPREAPDDAAAIEGDEQLEWAASYVADRLDAAVAQLDAAIASLDDIIDSEPTKTGYAEAAQRSIVLVLADGEMPRKAVRADAVAARAAVPALRAGLDAWVFQARGALST